MKTKIAVVLPSRGLVFSETIEELLRELKPYNHEIFWSHGKPIPDCFEIPTQEALKDPSFTHLLVVEEDMIIPKNAIKKMLSKKSHAIAYDYPVTGGDGGTVVYDPDGKAFFTGCGILLVRMDLIERLKPPIWRVDIEWGLVYKSSLAEFTIKIVDDKKNFGQQDIAFGLRLYYNEMPIEVVKQTTGQRKLIKRGKGFTNQGSHEIKEFRKVQKQDYLFVKEAYKDPFVELETEDGIINVTPESAQRLISQGLGSEIKKGYAHFYNTKVLKDWLCASS